MTINPYFNNYNHQPLQDITDSLVIEAIQQKGFDMNYLLREYLGEYDTVLGEAENYTANNTISTIEMYLDNVEQWGGQGNLFSKFGIEIHDTANFIVSKTRFEEIFSSQGRNVPAEGDYIWFGLSKSMFQIMEVIYDDQFWQFGGNYTYLLRCELASFANEKFETGNTAIQTEVSVFEGNANTAFIPFDNPHLQDEESLYIDTSEDNPYSL